MIWPPADSLRDFYGTPDGDHDGVADRKWEDSNLSKVLPPYKMVLAWNVGQTVGSIRCHKKVALSLLSVLQKIHASYEGDQDLIQRDRMHLYGGAYNFRTMRGSTKLSVHAYGAAIDLDPSQNPLGKPWEPGTGMIPKRVVDIFEDAGWQWGGRWHRPDCQHFQATAP